MRPMRLIRRTTVKEGRSRKAWWFWALIAVGVVIVGCGIAVLADWMLYRYEVHPGVSVHGVDLDGMTEDQATEALDRLVENNSGPVTLTSGDKTWTLTPADVGRAVDVPGTVARAMAETRENGFFTDVVTRFGLYFKRHDLPLIATVDRARLEVLITSIAADLHMTPFNASLKMRGGEMQIVQGVDGQDVPFAVFVDQVESLFVNLDSTTVEIPLVVKKPDVEVDDNQAAEQSARAMMSAPLTLTSHDKTWTISPEQIATWLDFRVQYKDGVPRLIPYLAEGSMFPFLTTVGFDVRKEPVDAGFKIVDGKPMVVPSVAGETLDVTATARALDSAAGEATRRTVEAVVRVIEPEFTTADAEATTFDDELASYTTEYWGSANRRVNVRLTTQFATDVFLAPGEEYDFDEQVGPRTPERGYRLAPGITTVNGVKKLVMEYGGGICQVSTTMFNAVFFAGLEVTERHNHSLYISHYPKGRDATVSAGGKNLRFVNDTDHYIWIRGTSDGVTTTISIYGTSDGREVAYTTRGTAGSYVKVIRQVTLPDGTVIHDDTFVSVW